MTPAKPAPKAKRDYQKHGITAAKQAIREYGTKLMDGRTQHGKRLAGFREALIEDLGGEDGISTQQRTMVELAVRQIMLLDVIDGFLWSDAENPLANIVNKRNRRLFPIAKERQSISNGLASTLTQLGLERRAKIPDLTDYVVETYGEGGAGASE